VSECQEYQGYQGWNVGNGGNMSNEVLDAWREETHAEWVSLCAEYGLPFKDMGKLMWVRAKMSDLKDAKKIRKILSDPRLLIYEWLFGERPADKPADSVGA